MLSTVDRPAAPSAEQLDLVRRAAQLLAEDDLATGISPTARRYCDGCRQNRPRAGSVQQGRYQLCTICVAEFEADQEWGEGVSIGQFVRDKQFGEADRYALPPG